MTRKKQLRALVSDRLAAAAEEILSGAERLLEMSLEQQRVVVHQRLSLVADNIFGMLETLMDEYEAEISSSHQDMEHPPRPAARTDICTADRLSRSTCAPRVQPSSSSPQQSKDVSEETKSQLISAEASRLGETQRAAKGDTTMTEQCGLPPRFDQEPSSDNSEAVCDDSDGNEEPCEKPLRSLKRKTLRYSREKKKEKWRKSPTEQIQLTGQSGCRVCGKVFHYKRSFLKHLLQHEQSSDLCGVCGKRLGGGESLKVHLQTHSKEHESRLQREAKSDEDWKESEGSDDGEEYAKRQRKGARSKDSSNLKYSCKVCGKSFCYRASFLKHVQEDERDADLCGVCGKRFQSKESLRLHLQTYIPTNDCEVCGKHFDGHQQLEMHTRTHTGEKPYICAICGKAFAQNGNLKAHMRVHTGERPFPCSVCGQSFGFKEYMLAHMRIHTGEKPFLCSVCGKGFRQRGSLRTHMIMHTGQSKHRCIVCDKKFYKSGALKIHMRSHTGERPYLCNVCGKGFTASGSLNKHMAVHQGERSHGCGACGEQFLRREDLRRHADMHQEGSSQLTTL